MATHNQLPRPLNPKYIDLLDSDFIEYYNAYIGIKVSGTTIHLNLFGCLRDHSRIYTKPTWHISDNYTRYIYNPFEAPG